MTKTTHQALVVRVTLEDLPNSDHLALGKFNGYQIVTNKHNWTSFPTYPEILCVHCPIDNTVDTEREEFKFLAKEGKQRFQVVKAAKLRGYLSEGFIFPVPDGFNEGDDVTEYFGIEHYEEEIEGEDLGKSKPDNASFIHKYDVDAAKNFYQELTSADEVVATIKYHGQNCLYVWDKITEKVCVRGRTSWQTYNVKDNCYKAYVRNKEVIDQFCKCFPNYVLWGEAYGAVGGYGYGRKGVDFIAFDIYDLENKCFLDYDIFVDYCNRYLIPRVREVYRGPFDFEYLKTLSGVPSEFPHPHEGIVIKTTKEKQNSKFERMCFKIINTAYKIGKEVDFNELSIAELQEMKRKIEIVLERKVCEVNVTA